MGDQPSAQITNTLFPPPPEYFKLFTDENAERYDKLTTRAGSRSPHPNDSEGGRELTTEEGHELDRLRGSLGRPRPDWIREEGRWVTFGEMSTTRAYIPTPTDIGLKPMYDLDEPPQTSLTPLLHSFLHTLLRLVDTLTNSARPPHELAEKGWAHEGDQYVQHMTNISANMMVAANQLREMQAEATLVLLMEKQLATRRQQTEALRGKCRSISNKIRVLRADAEGTSTGPGVEDRMEVDHQVSSTPVHECTDLLDNIRTQSSVVASSRLNNPAG